MMTWLKSKHITKYIFQINEILYASIDLFLFVDIIVV
jgi:hypothetical protein